MAEELREVYFTIDKEHKGVITFEDLEKYRQENNFNEDFIHQWKKLFDPENTGSIPLKKFYDVLGLTRMDIHENKFDTTTASDEKPEVIRIAEDMESDKQKVIFALVQQIEWANPTNDGQIVRSLKSKLDEKFGRLWHVFMIKGQYHAFYSYEAANSFCFKKGNRIYVIYKTPTH